MSISNFKFISENTGSINFGYFLSEEDLKLVVSESIINYPFGQFDTNVIETSVYNLNDDLLSWKIIDPVREFTPIHRVFVDLDGTVQSYSYNQLKQSFLVLHGEKQSTASMVMPDELVLNPVDDLKSFGFQEGSYKIVYNLVDNILGNEKSGSRLIIKDISPSRKELKVIPVSLKNSNKEEEIKLNDQFDLFSSDKVKVKFIIGDILKNIRSPRLTQLYYDLDPRITKQTIAEIKLNYSFKSDNDLIGFLQDTYQIVSDQFENFLYSNYEKNLEFIDLLNEFDEISNTVIVRELKKIRNSLTSPYDESFPQYVSFILELFESVLDIVGLEKLYRNRIGSHFKFGMNFGNGRILPVVKWKLSSENINDPIKSNVLLIKLADELPTDIVEKDSFWISNFSISLPIVQNFIIFKESTIKTISLRGPDFQTRIENLGESTKKYSFDKLIGKNEESEDISAATQKLLSYINKNFFERNLNVDYRYFENFAHFSSAQTRLDNFNGKVEGISSLDSKISNLQSISSSLSNLMTEEVFIKLEIETLNQQKEDIINGFDGYETFLYNNPDTYEDHSRFIGIGLNAHTSASLYDEFNDDRLINNTAEYIVKNEDNSEYLKFLDMIGQHFDLIWLYIKGMPSIQPPENRTNEGIAQNIVWHMLLSLGWDPESGTANQDLLLNIFGIDKDENVIEKMSGKERTQLIWRRLLNNLPYIFKKKGTEEAYRALLSCYGIPASIFKIREYGGIEYSTDITQDSLFIFDNRRFSLRFGYDNEYLKFPWFEDSKTLEFNVSFNTAKTFPEGSQYTLALCDDRWAIGVIRDKGTDWGKVYFTTRDVSGSIKSTVTGRLPIFNGDRFSIMLKKDYINNLFDLPISASSSDIDLVPTKYELFAKRSENDRIIFEESSSINLSGSYNTIFREGENVYLGNFNLSSGSTEAFFGTMDQIQMWKIPLSEERFNNHMFFNEAYDSEDPTTTVDNLLLRLDFTNPKNLFSPTSQSYIENSSYNQNFITFVTASNFHNLNTFSSSLFFVPDPEIIVIETEVSASFPFHFNEYDTREVVRIPNFGANKFRSNKIRIETQELISQLSFDSRATAKSRDRNPADSTTLGLFFTPIDLINTDILRFFGNFELADLVGNPAQLYDTQYKPLLEFIPIYFNNGPGRVDFQSYLNLIKAYFDKSLFKHIESLAPARSKLITGLLIEPTILERPKIALKPIFREIHNNLSSSINAKENISAEKFPDLTDFIDVKTNSNKIKKSNYETKDPGLDFPEGFDKILDAGTGSNVSVSKNYVDFIDDSLILEGYGNLAIDGSIFKETIEDNQSVTTEYKLEILKIKRNRHSVNVDGTFDLDTKKVETTNIIPIISGSFERNSDSRLLNGYYFNHFKFKRDVFGKLSKQTQDTTVDEVNGIPNGSVPATSTKVDRGVISVASQGGGVILNAQ